MHGENRTRGQNRSGSGRIRVLSVGEADALRETADGLERQDESLAVEARPRPGDALDRLDDEWFDCIVSGYRTPGMNGVEFLRAVRAEYDDRPFVLFTGRGDEAVAAEAIRTGVTDYVPREGEDAYATLARRIRVAVERRRSGGRMEAFFESGPDALVVVDVDGVVRRANARAEKLLGDGPQGPLGESVVLLGPDDGPGDPGDQDDRKGPDGPGFGERLEAPGGKSTGLDVRALRTDGSEFPVDAALGPVRVADRPAVMVAVRDGSARARREQCRRRDDRLEEFASVLSHDLRNPMTVAEGNVELARRTGDLEYLERAEGAHDRMQSLVEDLLTLVREGATVEDPVPVSPSAAAETAWTTVETDEATLRADAIDDLLADRPRLRRLLEQLFRNAVEHGSTSPPPKAPEDAAERGSTENETGRDGVTVRIGPLEGGFYVADDGPGIPEADREDAFEYGYSTSEEGDGLGLALAENIATAHGWRVSVTESRAGGARFEITGVERAG